ncbi:hypothetical protein EJ110_NYTH09763 [Nymphaea thermarum]|nr:hypothetical protein EJ110_NYTH09763 [Nymphaea thermarum]
MDGHHGDDDDDDPNLHEHAIVELSGRYGGAKGSFNVWKPFVESATEASISQLWVTRMYDNGNVATLEAGWMVSSSFIHTYQEKHESLSSTIEVVSSYTLLPFHCVLNLLASC